MAEVTEEEVRNLAMQHREYQKRAEAIQQQMNMVQISRDDCIRALATIEELDALEEGIETMVPIGAGSFVYGSFNDLSKVIVNVGAGISVEKSIDGAKEILNHRKEELGKILENMNVSLNKIAQGMQSIEAMVAKFNVHQ
ncbi:MAG: prefoldin subunit alpha [Methanosarcinaceae archaeon]|nr:prefoldin subunit alpha [Methanosarcinaceae archaeon]